LFSFLLGHILTLPLHIGIYVDREYEEGGKNKSKFNIKKNNWLQNSSSTHRLILWRGCCNSCCCAYRYILSNSQTIATAEAETLLLEKFSLHIAWINRIKQKHSFSPPWLLFCKLDTISREFQLKSSVVCCDSQGRCKAQRDCEWKGITKT
jgi:hypothetical protein